MPTSFARAERDHGAKQMRSVQYHVVILFLISLTVGLCALYDFVNALAYVSHSFFSRILDPRFHVKNTGSRNFSFCDHSDDVERDKECLPLHEEYCHSDEATILVLTCRPSGLPPTLNPACCGWWTEGLVCETQDPITDLLQSR